LITAGGESIGAKTKERPMQRFRGVPFLKGKVMKGAKLTIKTPPSEEGVEGNWGKIPETKPSYNEGVSRALMVCSQTRKNEGCHQFKEIFSAAVGH